MLPRRGGALLRRGSSAKTLLSERSGRRGSLLKGPGPVTPDALRMGAIEALHPGMRLGSHVCFLLGTTKTEQQANTVIRGIIEGVGPSRDLLLVRSLGAEGRVHAWRRTST